MVQTILPSPGDPGFEANDWHPNIIINSAIQRLELGTFGQDLPESASFRTCICYWREVLANSDWWLPIVRQRHKKTGWQMEVHGGHDYKTGDEGVATGKGPDPFGEAYNPFAEASFYDMKSRRFVDGEWLQHYPPPSVPEQRHSFDFRYPSSVDLFLSSSIDAKSFFPSSAKGRKLHEDLPSPSFRPFYPASLRASAESQRRKASNAALLQELQDPGNLNANPRPRDTMSSNNRDLPPTSNRDPFLPFEGPAHPQSASPIIPAIALTLSPIDPNSQTDHLPPLSRITNQLDRQRRRAEIESREIEHRRLSEPVLDPFPHEPVFEHRGAYRPAPEYSGAEERARSQRVNRGLHDHAFDQRESWGGVDTAPPDHFYSQLPLIRTPSYPPLSRVFTPPRQRSPSPSPFLDAAQTHLDTIDDAMLALSRLDDFEVPAEYLASVFDRLDVLEALDTPDSMFPQSYHPGMFEGQFLLHPPFPDTPAVELVHAMQSAITALGGIPGLRDWARDFQIALDMVARVVENWVEGGSAVPPPPPPPPPQQQVPMPWREVATSIDEVRQQFMFTETTWEQGYPVVEDGVNDIFAVQGTVTQFVVPLYRMRQAAEEDARRQQQQQQQQGDEVEIDADAETDYEMEEGEIRE
ncbi:hypothetical protein K461DRAFT_313204 [Myriangium duriaei CBS 260.36]|uniref:Uncharacterized protein n=1 Tax=Myriangium duriaei CBS 260.36 TaxID=1168546 RepID=A0A9P4IZ33_9PEZI|nr:hypothetical protein K461DRAFT_313204 [Myriangium duriaei CBS 260.36]